MKKIIVTPAGRKRYLSILSKYIIKYKDEFDEWHLWCNTTVPEDVNYIYELAEQNDFIKVIDFPSDETISTTCGVPSIQIQGGNIIYPCTIPYFIKVDTVDENAVYLRLDDDIVFIRNESIKNIFEYRIQNNTNFLVYGNIVNNSAISNIHQNIGVLPKTLGEVSFNAFDPIGLYSGAFSDFSHRTFFEKLKYNLLKEYIFPPCVLAPSKLVSIQVISWLGKDYKKFNGIIPIGTHEEHYQSFIRPDEENKTNVIFGDGLFCHYSAGVNRSYVDTTNILQMYNYISEEYLKTFKEL